MGFLHERLSFSQGLPFPTPQSYTGVHELMALIAAFQMQDDAMTC